MLYSPESPKWLETHFKFDEMKKASQKLWKNVTAVKTVPSTINTVSSSRFDDQDILEMQSIVVLI